jgi:hypothetical protein
MRTFVEPPPSSRCKFCGGELRLKLIESAKPNLDLDNEIFVCVKCGHEQSYAVSHHNRTGGMANEHVLHAVAWIDPVRYFSVQVLVREKVPAALEKGKR